MHREPHYTVNHGRARSARNRRYQGLRPVPRTKGGTSMRYGVHYDQRSIEPRQSSLSTVSGDAVASVSRNFAFRTIIVIFTLLALLWGLINAGQWGYNVVVEPWLQARSLRSLGYDSQVVDQLMLDESLSIRTALLDGEVNNPMLADLSSRAQFDIKQYRLYDQVFDLTANRDQTYQFVLQVAPNRQYQSDHVNRYISAIANQPRFQYETQTAAGVVEFVGLGLDFDQYESIRQTSNPASVTVLVDKRNQLPEDYVPADLVTLSSRNSNGDVRLRRDARDALDAMLVAAALDGVDYFATSGYRSYAQQKSIYDERFNQGGADYADRFSARPGHSEHQTGLAVDVTARSDVTCNLRIDCFTETRSYDWLADNAHLYGFVQSYTVDNQWATDYAAEAWHWRYIGADAATTMRAEGIESFQQYAFRNDLIN